MTIALMRLKVKVKVKGQKSSSKVEMRSEGPGARAILVLNLRSYRGILQCVEKVRMERNNHIITYRDRSIPELERSRRLQYHLAA